MRSASETADPVSATVGAPEPTDAGRLATLRIPAFRLILLENLSSQIGQNARLMAQAWLVLELTDSDTWVGLVNGTPAIPVAMLTLLGGTIVDRFNRRRILLLTRLTVAALGLLTAFLIVSDTIRVWHLLALAIGFGIGHAGGMIANQTIVVDVVGRPQLLRANALYSLTLNSATFVGPALGGLVVTWAGIDAAFLLLAAVALLAAGFASLLRFEQPRRESKAPTLFGDLLVGARYVYATPVLRWLILVSLFVMFLGAYQVTIPRIARDELGLEAGGYGTILAASGFGGLAGALIQIWVGRIRSFGSILLGVGLAFGLLVTVFALVQTVAAAIIVAFFIGFLFPWWGNTIRTALQTAARDDMRGVASSLFALAAQTIPLGWLVGGAISDAFSPRATLLVSAVAVAAAHTLAYAVSKDLRRLGGD